MKRHQRHPDERGAILVLSAVGVVLAMIAAALAIDLGSLAQEARADQKVADLAALDAVRALPGDPTGAARASATRNDFDYAAPGYGLLVEWATSPSGPFTSSPASLGGATSVRVTVTSPHENNFPFVAGGRSVSRKAVATTQAEAGFALGSSLATIDTDQARLLNRLLGRMVGDPDANLNVALVGWQGLASGGVTLGALQSELADLGFGVGTVDQLLGANLTAPAVYQATATALTNQGGAANLANANILNAIRLQAASSATFKLGQFVEVAQGSEDSALASTVNLFQLVTSTAEVAGGNSFVEVDSGIAVPGVLDVKVGLKVISPQVMYFGPVDAPTPHAETAQVELTVTPNLDLDVSIAGLAGAKVRNPMPLKLTAAGATADLASVVCADPGKGIRVTADPKAFSATGTSTLEVSAMVLLARVPLVRVPTTGIVSSIDGPPADRFFAYPSEFPPPAGTYTSKQVGSEPLGLGGLTTFTQSGPPVVLGVLPVSVGNVVSAVMNALGPVFERVDDLVVTRVLNALGLNVGTADIAALSLGNNGQCDTPRLAG